MLRGVAGSRRFSFGGLERNRGWFDSVVLP